jgi:PAS domain S-box-containing protein
LHILEALSLHLALAISNAGLFTRVQKELKQKTTAEEALRQSQELLQAIIDSSPSPIFMTDLEGRYTLVNRELEKIIGHPRTEIIGQNREHLYSSQDGQQYLENDRTVIRTKQELVVEETIDVPGGKQTYLTIKFPIINQSGDVVAVAGISNDITARKRIEEENFRISERIVFVNQIDHLIMAANSIDQIGDEVLRRLNQVMPFRRGMIILNDQNDQTLSVIAQHVHGKKLIQVGDRFVSDPKIEKVLKDNHLLDIPDLSVTEPRSPLMEKILEEGCKHYISIPMMAREKIMGGLILTADEPGSIVEENVLLAKEVANQLGIAIQQWRLYEQTQSYATNLEKRVQERTTELENKNKELETFSYTVSHDLKAPLRGLDGYSQLLVREYGDQLDEEGRLFITNIRNATKQMNQLIDDLLTYSRVERRSLSESEVDLQSLLRALLAERMELIRDQKIATHIEIPFQQVRGDSESYNQVFRNLIDNAIKFTRDVPNPFIDIIGTEDEDRYLIKISDNGIGFDMKYQEKIFEIFQRLHRADEYPGTGIGLAIVRKAVERMGGRVWAESSQGKGATFFLEIPK